MTKGMIPDRKAHVAGQIITASFGTREVSGDEGFPAGDGDRCARAFQRPEASLRNYLERRLTTSAEAEEVLQEVFLQAWRSADRFRPERSSLRGWLTVIARTRALDHLRSGLARQRREQAVGRGAAVVAWPTTAVRLDEVRRRRRLRSALETLAAEQRVCIRLSFYQGLSHGQIAARLNLPLGTVKSRILLGLRKLRRCLEEGRPAA